jgi:hypothetical protein
MKWLGWTVVGLVVAAVTSDVWIAWVVDWVLGDDDD